MVTNDEALVELLAALKDRNYHFIAVTPATHERVLARPLSKPPTPRDIFGWNRIFEEHQIEPQLLTLLRRSGFVEEADGRLRSLIRVASLGDDLFLHSGFPTNAPDAVFFGPDTYRFTRFVRAQLPAPRRSAWIVDMGSGSGAGAIIAAKQAPPSRLSMVDVNPAAARLARVNLTFAGLQAETIVGDEMPKGCDLVIANPPYMIDSAHRAYRDGGTNFGGEIACSWVAQALDALVPGGCLLLYTGAAVIEGKLPLLDRTRALCDAAEAALDVDEIDPDVFGEELERPEYERVERIAVLGIKITTR